MLVSVVEEKTTSHNVNRNHQQTPLFQKLVLTCLTLQIQNRATIFSSLIQKMDATEAVISVANFVLSSPATLYYGKFSIINKNQFNFHKTSSGYTAAHPQETFYSEMRAKHLKIYQRT